MKLVRIPPMNVQDGSLNWVQRLLAQFSPIVHAQGMGYGGLYTTVTVDLDGIVYATGTTNAMSGCSCHQAMASTTVTLPTGHAAQATSYGPGEIAQATAVLDMTEGDFTDGDIYATTHTAYCPYLHRDFINNVQTGITNPFISIYAYYFCQPRGGPCVKAPNPMTGERTYTHDRCNPGKVCNRIYSRNNNWPFTLQRVVQISIGGDVSCIAAREGAQQRLDCGSPDPKP
jgi:hypothetical protein